MSRYGIEIFDLQISFPTQGIISADGGFKCLKPFEISGVRFQITFHMLKISGFPALHKKPMGQFREFTSQIMGFSRISLQIKKQG